MDDVTITEGLLGRYLVENYLLERQLKEVARENKGLKEKLAAIECEKSEKEVPNDERTS